jgi:hypothetical protein
MWENTIILPQNAIMWENTAGSSNKPKSQAQKSA